MRPMPIPVKDGKGRVGETAEDPAHDERLGAVLQAVEEVFRDGEPEADGRAVDDAVHDAGELDQARSSAA